MATKLGINSSLFIVIMATIIALFLPIVIEKIANKWRATKILFLGKK